MKQIDLFTDGACSGNPGPGGWGLVMRYQQHEKELNGGEEDTTNNRMELRAVIEGLKQLKQPCHVTIHTDSKYVMDGIKQYLARWKRNGWRTSNKKPVKNIDLWQELDDALQRHQTDWVWVKGHSGHPENERADALARAGIPAQSNFDIDIDSVSDTE